MIFDESLASTTFFGLALFAAVASCSREEEPRAFPAATPKIDVHTHISPSAYERALDLMDQAGVQIAVNLSGGMPGAGLEQSLAVQERSGKRIRVFCNLDLRGVEDPRFAGWATGILRRCKEAGALGLKIPKSLGLGVLTSEGLLAVDDPRLDPVFDEAGRLGMVVLIHVGDPEAFFEPARPENERWEELSAHPEWSFADPRFPRWTEILDAFERRIARHPRTRFIGAHFGNAAEDPERVARMLDRYPNYFIDTAARVPEFGRHPAPRMRRFFVRYQDRILFGTDLGVSEGSLMLGSTDGKPVTRAAIDRFFSAHWRYFETTSRQIENPTPIQGRWRIDAIGLSTEVLRKLYWANAARLLGITVPRYPARPTPLTRGHSEGKG
ncbi:MAG: amidohydrolase family protein [Deltaproteobacteria bacterium]|nr:amidohydrolase family protein [Deltaproteobacteria bacterium]